MIPVRFVIMKKIIVQKRKSVRVLSMMIGKKNQFPEKISIRICKSKNVLKVLVIVMVVLLVIFGFLFIALIAINQEAFAIASNCENRIQGGVQYVLQPMREILAG